MGSIILHPEKGLNPFMTCCRKCGKDVGLVLVGRRDYIDKCGNCGMNHIGGVDVDRKCKGCDRYATYTRRKLEDREKLAVEICDDCKAEIKKHKALCDQHFQTGGIAWICSDCGSEGVLKGTSQLAVALRNHANLPAPAPCGVEFSKKDCPVCGPNKLV